MAFRCLFFPSGARRVRGSRRNQYTQQRAEEMIRALSNPPCSKSHSHFHGFKSLPHTFGRHPPSALPLEEEGAGKSRETEAMILTCPGEKRQSRHCASRSRRSRRSPGGFPAPGSAWRSENNHREQDQWGITEINGSKIIPVQAQSARKSVFVSVFMCVRMEAGVLQGAAVGPLDLCQGSGGASLCLPPH